MAYNKKEHLRANLNLAFGHLANLESLGDADAREVVKALDDIAADARGLRRRLVESRR